MKEVIESYPVEDDDRQRNSIKGSARQWEPTIISEQLRYCFYENAIWYSIVLEFESLKFGLSLNCHQRLVVGSEIGFK